MHISEIAKQIRSGELNLGRRNYALCLAHGVLQAQMCGHSRIAAIEFGVYEGHGLMNLCAAADYFTQNCGIQIDVYGFDLVSGLPAQSAGYKDHPEVWRQGFYQMNNYEHLKNQLPPFCKLIVGNTSETVPVFMKQMEETDVKLGMVALDVDLYTSSVSCLKVFELSPNNMLPAVPMYVDDVNYLITYNEWCGEALAIKEFNETHELRKIDYKPNFRIDNFYVCHAFDHPARTGVANTTGLEICAKPAGCTHIHDAFTI